MLERLFLIGTGITDSGLEHLRGLTELQRLDLSRTRVSDKGLKNLRGMLALERLDLYETRVTDAGEAELWQVLPDVVIYSPIKFGGNFTVDALLGLGKLSPAAQKRLPPEP